MQEPFTRDDGRTRTRLGASHLVRALVLTWVSIAGLAWADAAPDCLDPASCTLAEAAAPHGIRIGLFDGLSSPERRAIVLEQANAHTNHGFSWNVMQPAPDVWNFAAADPGYAFAVENGFHQTGLHFAWSQAFLDDLPDWVREIDDAETLRDALRERARVIFERYPLLDRIDVINEPLQVSAGGLFRNHFHQVLGPDYIDQLFAIVDAEAPEHVELFVNENLTEYFPAKAEGLVDLVRGLVERGVAIDAVGLQTHLLFATEIDWDAYRAMMEEIAALGLTVFVSELDVATPIDQEDRFAWQAERYRRAVETCVSVPACDEITVWGVDDPTTWLQWFLEPGLDPLLYDAKLRPKPAWFAFRDALLAPEPSAAGLAWAAVLTMATIRRVRSSGRDRD